MPAQSKAELARRWTTPRGQQRAAEVLRAWNSGDPLDRLECGLVQGRIDLRGFRLPGIAEAGQVRVGSVSVTELAADPPRVVDARIADVDLTGAALSHVTFDGCSLINVRWDHAELTRTAFLGCDVFDTSFRSARFSRGVLSTGEPDRFRNPPTQRGTAFRKCTFDRARINGIVCEFALFEDCALTFSAVSGVTFYRPVIRRSGIAGALSDVQFDGRDGLHPGPEVRPELADVDFRAARFVDVGFDTISLRGVSWPTAHRYVLLRGDVAGFFRRALGMLESIPAAERVVIDEYVERGAGQVPAGQSEWMIQTDVFAGEAAEHDFELQGERQLLQLVSASEADVTAEVHLPE